MTTRTTHFTEHCEKYAALTEVIAALNAHRDSLVAAMITLLAETTPKEKADARAVVNSLDSAARTKLISDPSLCIELGIRRQPRSIRTSHNPGSSDIL